MQQGKTGRREERPRLLFHTHQRITSGFMRLVPFPTEVKLLGSQGRQPPKRNRCIASSQISPKKRNHFPIAVHQAASGRTCGCSPSRERIFILLLRMTHIFYILPYEKNFVISNLLQNHCTSLRLTPISSTELHLPVSFRFLPTAVALRENSFEPIIFLFGKFVRPTVSTKTPSIDEELRDHFLDPWMSSCKSGI